MNITDSQLTSETSSRARTADLGLLLVRVVFGGLLAAAGLQKLFGWFGGPGLTETGAAFQQIGYSPGVFFAAVAGLLEAVGGLLLLLGLFTTLASSIVIGVMINAVSATWSGGLFGQAGYQLPLLYATAGALIACTGAGVLALDHGRTWQREGAAWAAASIVTGIAAAIAVLLLKAVL
ncbi:DoxX family protein [Mycobacterium sp.]|uniref:DoxX family protein n=1 Tax=Mycobacterium sp. TaxID=1785 RepID=UPI002D86D7A4|nr:DoxX family protein [Mycobacterium sp.]